MRSRIRQQNCIAVSEEYLRRSEHPCTVVAHAMEKNYRVAVSGRRPDAPGAQLCAIAC